MNDSDYKWLTEQFSFNEFTDMVTRFIKNSQLATKNGTTKGLTQKYNFRSGFSLQNRYGMGAVSKTTYINWHVVNIYYHVAAHTLYIAIQDDPKREINAKQISDYEHLTKGAEVMELPGKGRVYKYFEMSDKPTAEDLNNLYAAFFDLCSQIAPIAPDVEFKKWNFGDSKPGFIVKRPTHDERIAMRKGLNGRLRVKILMRDKSTCQICGKTPKDNVTLHVDHILPVSRGGTNEESNLRVLCHTCNTSKGARLV